MRKALRTSVFAMAHPFPNCLMILIASSTVAYLTEENSTGMKLLPEPPRGKERWWMFRYSPGVFLRITPKGEKKHVENGVFVKGSMMRPNSLSLASLLSTMAGFG